MGSQPPSPNVKTLCSFEPQIWPEILTSRDAESTCFKGSRTSCDVMILGIVGQIFGRKKKITPRDGCFLPIRVLCGDFKITLLFRNFPVPAPVLSRKSCRKNGGRAAAHVGGVLQYRWEMYCWASISSRLRTQEGTAIQMKGVLPYKLEVYCSTFFKTSRGWGF